MNIKRALMLGILAFIGAFKREMLSGVRKLFRILIGIAVLFLLNLVVFIGVLITIAVKA